MKHVYLVYEHHRPPGWLLQENDITTTMIGAFTKREYAEDLLDWYAYIDRDIERDEFYKYEIIEQELDAHPPTLP